MLTRVLLVILAAASLDAQVTFDRILRADKEPQNWLTYSGSTAGQRYSALTQINAENAKNLTMQWAFQARSTEKFEATPLVEEKGNVPLRYLCTGALVTIFLQLILGATLRHSATWDQRPPVELILAHIGGAVAVTLMLGAASLSVLRRHPETKFLTRPAIIALTLLAVQLCLGIAAYMTRLASPNDPQPLNPMIAITVAHVACGALVFVSTIVLTLRTYRVLPASEEKSFLQDYRIRQDLHVNPE